MTLGLYWGDMHAHTYCGLVFGSPEEAMEIARTHLDFCCTPEHAIGQPRNEERFPEYWKHSRAVLNQNNEPGTFVTIMGYEWGLPGYGDMNVYFADDATDDLVVARSFAECVEYVESVKAILIPHHTAYVCAPAGTYRDRYRPTVAEDAWRDFRNDYYAGTDWDHYVPSVMPVMEIFSMHGSSERDGGPFPLNLPWMGIRASGGTFLSALERGCKLGAIASSDGHVGYPGEYQTGLVAAYATELSREAIWDAILARRTYAVSGDRIKLNFRINDQPMGSELVADRRELLIEVEGENGLDQIDIIKNGRLWKRETRMLAENTIAPRAKVRVEWGWGGMEVTEWRGELNVADGRIVGHTPNFGPPAPSYVERVDDSQCQWVSHTAGAPPDGALKKLYLRHSKEATDQIVFEIEGGPDTVVDLRLNGHQLRYSLADLAKGSQAEVVEGDRSMGGRKVKIHQAVGEARYTAAYHITDTAPERDEDYYYVRVTQENGQMAWSSPIWVSR